MTVSAIRKDHNAAETVLSMPGPGGSIMHAELRIADSIVMVGSVMGDAQPMPGQVHCYVEDVDAVSGGSATPPPPSP